MRHIYIYSNELVRIHVMYIVLYNILVKVQEHYLHKFIFLSEQRD